MHKICYNEGRTKEISRRVRGWLLDTQGTHRVSLNPLRLAPSYHTCARDGVSCILWWLTVGVGVDRHHDDEVRRLQHRSSLLHVSAPLCNTNKSNDGSMIISYNGSGVDRWRTRLRWWVPITWWCVTSRTRVSIRAQGGEKHKGVEEKHRDREIESDQGRNKMVVKLSLYINVDGCRRETHTMI